MKATRTILPAGALCLIGVLICCLPDQAAGQQAGEMRNVLFLDGGNGYAILPPHVTSGLTDATVEAWVQWSSIKKWARVFDFGREGNAAVVQNEKASRTVNFAIYDRQSTRHRIQARSVVRQGGWHHVAVVCGRGGMKFYFDGQLVGQDVYRGSLAEVAGGMNLVGKSNWLTDELFHGYISEFRLWGKSRTHRDIMSDMYTQLPGKQDGLVGYWRFGEADERTVEDLSGNGNDATLAGTATLIKVPGPPIKSAETEKKVGDKPKAASPAAPPPPPAAVVFGHLQVNTNASGSRVYVNNVYRGEANPAAPLNLENVGLGLAEVRVEAKGHQTVSKKTLLISNKWAQAIIELPAAVATGPARGGNVVLDLNPAPGDQAEVELGAKPGEQVVVDLVALKGAQGKALVEVTLRYDSEVVTLVKFLPNGLLKGGEAVVDITASGAKVSAALFGSNMVQDSGSLGHLIFGIVGPLTGGTRIVLVGGSYGEEAFTVDSQVRLTASP